MGEAKLFHYLASNCKNSKPVLLHPYILYYSFLSSRETCMLTLFFLLDYLGRPVIVQENVNPCVPSPCGPSSQCRVVGSHAACSCLPNYVGRAPNCRPECTINEECPSNLACQAERCRDPCAGSCGAQTTCIVVKHSPVCNCQTGFTGDPFSGCSKIASKIVFLTAPYSLFLFGSSKKGSFKLCVYISPHSSSCVF